MSNNNNTPSLLKSVLREECVTERCRNRGSFYNEWIFRTGIRRSGPTVPAGTISIAVRILNEHASGPTFKLTISN